MTLTQNSNISYFEQKSVQSVTKCHKVSQSVTKFTKHSFRDGVVVVVGGWKPILVYSSGPTFELELELELDLT